MSFSLNTAFDPALYIVHVVDIACRKPLPCIREGLEKYLLALRDTIHGLQKSGELGALFPGQAWVKCPGGSAHGTECGEVASVIGGWELAVCSDCVSVSVIMGRGFDG